MINSESCFTRFWSRSRLIKLGLIVLGPLLCLGFIEIALRIFRPAPILNPGWLDSYIYPKHQGGAKSPSLKSTLNIVVPVPSDRLTKRNRFDLIDGRLEVPIDFSRRYPRDLSLKAEEYRFKSNLSFESMVSSGNQEIFKVIIGTDGYGRRLTPTQTEKNPSKFLALFGCSFVFGDGLNNDATISAHLSRRLDHYAVYNYGYPGGSPAVAWMISDRRDLAAEIPESSVSVLYFLWDFHFSRLVNRRAWVLRHRKMGDRPWLLPNEALDDLVLAGKVLDRKLLMRWYRLLSSFRLFDFLGLDWFPWYRQSDFDLLVASIRGIEKNIREHKSLDRFAVVLPPGFTQNLGLIQAMRDRLNQAGITTYDFTDWDLTWLLEGRPDIPYDGHPSGNYNQFFSKHLAQLLREQDF